MLTRGSLAALVAALGLAPSLVIAQKADTAGTAASPADSSPPAPVTKAASPAPAVVAGVGTIRVDGLLQAW